MTIITHLKLAIPTLIVGAFLLSACSSNPLDTRTQGEIPGSEVSAGKVEGVTTVETDLQQLDFLSGELDANAMSETEITDQKLGF